MSNEEFLHKIPMSKKVDNKKTIQGLIDIYNQDKKGQKPFYKYQLRLMKDILRYVEKLGKTKNIRFIYSDTNIYCDLIIKHFVKRGYKWQRINDSLEWLALNLKY